jgi:hypothetical protein
MSVSINYGKVLLVGFLTILIWVWADLAMDEDFVVSSVKIDIAKSANPKLWVSFNNEPHISIKKVVLRGPVSRITEVRRKLSEGSLAFELYLDPEQEGMTTARQYTLVVSDFLRRTDQMKQLGLAVKSCDPDKVTVDAVELVRMPLVVKCLDEEQVPVETAAIEPHQVDMFVPKDWSGEKLVAKVLLSRREISQARLSAIEKKPFIELSPGQFREAPTAVKITTPAQESRLNDYTITTATLGFILSPNLQGKYKIEVINLNEVIRSITIKAAADAKQAYDKMRYQVILEIDDSDSQAKPTEPLRKELIYNFPSEYVRKNEIMLNQQPAVARFNLIPVSAEAPAPATP